MALDSLIRSSIKRAAPLAGRLFGGQRLIHSSPSPLFAAAAVTPRQFAPASFISARSYASPAAKRPSNDQTLLEIIESEIVSAKEYAEELNESAQKTPEDFPFKIEDNPGQNTISLLREYQGGETVSVEVYMPNHSAYLEDDNDSSDDNEKSNQSSYIPMVVRVTKIRGPLLEFEVTAYLDLDEIAIDRLSVKNPELSEDQIGYEGPDFSDLDENLQKAFHKYLEIRGIKPSNTNFLHEYMTKKDNVEYLRWLNNLKQFVKA